MTDAVSLIGLIYKYSKQKRIPVESFEKIITKSYEAVWNISDKDKGRKSGDKQGTLMQQAARNN